MHECVGAVVEDVKEMVFSSIGIGDNTFTLVNIIISVDAKICVGITLVFVWLTLERAKIKPYFSNSIQINRAVTRDRVILKATKWIEAPQISFPNPQFS